jgi:hypothetical protein
MLRHSDEKVEDDAKVEDEALCQELQETTDYIVPNKI